MAESLRLHRVEPHHRVARVPEALEQRLKLPRAFHHAAVRRHDLAVSRIERRQARRIVVVVGSHEYFLRGQNGLTDSIGFSHRFPLASPSTKVWSVLQPVQMGLRLAEILGAESFG